MVQMIKDLWNHICGPFKILWEYRAMVISIVGFIVVIIIINQLIK